MRFVFPKKEARDPKDWQWKFALWPTRVSATTVVWLEWYERALEVVAEGNWAGGYQWRWRYLLDSKEAWSGPVHGD